MGSRQNEKCVQRHQGRRKQSPYQDSVRISDGWHPKETRTQETASGGPHLTIPWLLMEFGGRIFIRK